jgi:hypothetical protein
MADMSVKPAQGFGPSLSVMVVLAMAIAALVPHVLPERDSGRAAQTSTHADSSGKENDTAAMMTATDLLAEYFQIDVSKPALEGRVRKAISQVRIAAQEPSPRPILVAMCQDAAPAAASECDGRSPIQLAAQAQAVLTHRTEPPTLTIESGSGIARVRPPQGQPSFSSLDTPALRTAIVQEAASTQTVKFLIATLPDWVDSYETWQFDPDLDGLRRGIEASGYSLDRFWLPDVAAPNDPAHPPSATLHTRFPGVAIFSGEAQQLLVLFVVPETPALGIHAEPMRRSLEFASRWLTAESGAGSSRLAGIIGPTFSGSAQSLATALHNDHALIRTLSPIRVLSGNASNDSNRSEIEYPSECGHAGHSPCEISFRATIHPNRTINRAVCTFQQAMGISGAAAVISEDTTRFGHAESRQIGMPQEPDDAICLPSQSGVTKTVHITVPFNIAQLRSDAAQTARPERRLDFALPSRPLPFQDFVTPTDRLPLRVPQMASVHAEAQLQQLIDALQREQVGVVRVSTTDVRDRLFLIRELRQRAPDIVVIATDGDLLYAHREQYRWTSNLLIVSSYPLHVITQELTQSPHLVQFPNLGSEGIYNATVAALDYDSAGVSTGPARLIDYGSPHPRSGDSNGMVALQNRASSGNPPCRDIPPVWLSVVGRHGSWPVQLARGQDEDSDPYLFSPVCTEASLSDGATTSVASAPPTFATRTLLIALSLITLLLAGITYYYHAPRSTIWPIAVALLLLIVGSAAIERPLLLVSIVLGPSVILLAVSQRWAGARTADVSAVAGVTALLGALVCGYFWAARTAPLDVWVYRMMDIGGGVSPLLPLLLIGLIPILMCAVVLRFHYVHEASNLASWGRRTLDVLCFVTLDGPSRGRRRVLQKIQTRLFYLPLPAAIGIGFILLAVWASVFEGRVWSAEGAWFGWLVMGAVMIAQLLLTFGLLQFWIHWRNCATLLGALARGRVAAAYPQVKPELVPRSLLPRRPRLYELSAVIDALGIAAREQIDRQLRKELRRSPAARPRWWDSNVWTRVILPEVRHAIVRLKSGDSGSARDMLCVATATVLVMRELLARLSVCLLIIGPSLGILIALQGTVAFQGSHRLLALVWIDVAVTIVVTMAAFIQMDLDETLSLVTNTAPGKLNVNFDLMSKVAVYVVLPVVALLASQFPNVGESIADLFNSLPTIP